MAAQLRDPEAAPGRSALERSTPAVIGFALLGVLAVVVQHLVISLDEPFWGLFDNQLDLDVYRSGVLTVFDGGRLYEAKLAGPMDYTYAPISMFFFAPLAAVSFEAARILWTAAIFVALYLVIMLGFRSLGHQATGRLRIIAIALVAITLLIEPVRTTVWYGQVNVFLMLVILADLMRADGSRLRGVGTGITAGIKLTPMIFVLYLLLLRQWRAAMTVVGTFVATVAIGFVILPRDAWAYWTNTLFDTDRVASPQTVGNQSLRGAMANLGDTDEPSTALWVLGSVLVVAIGMWAAVLAHRHHQELLALSLVGMASCVVSPVAWGHHWVWFVPMLVVGIHLLFLARLSLLARLLVAVGLIGGFLSTFIWLTYLDHPIWFLFKTVPDGQLTGLFFRHQDVPWLRWYVIDPYNWIFLCSALATIVCCLLARRRAVAADGPAVGARR